MSDELEVNTNCLDDYSKNKSQKDDFIAINMTASKNSNRNSIDRSEGGGDGLEKSPHYEDYTVDDDFQPIGARANYVGAQAFYDVETVYEEDSKGDNMKWKNSDYGSQASTPAATLTLSGSCLSSSESSTSDGYSCEGNYIDDGNDDSVIKSSWSATSSLRSSARRNHNEISPSTRSTSGRTKSRPTSSMNDQLKYYIKKHMRSPSTPQERTKKT